MDLLDILLDASQKGGVSLQSGNTRKKQLSENF